MKWFHTSLGPLPTWEGIDMKSETVVPRAYCTLHDPHSSAVGEASGTLEAHAVSLSCVRLCGAPALAVRGESKLKSPQQISNIKNYSTASS